MKKLNKNQLFSIIGAAVMIVLTIAIILIYQFLIKPIKRPQPYDSYFKVNYVVDKKDIKSDKAFTNGSGVVSISTVSNDSKNVGYIVSVVAQNIKIDASGNGKNLSNEFDFKLFFDNNKKLLGHEFKKYGHSGDSFKANVDNFLNNSLKNKTISEINEFLKTEDNLKTGSSETTKSTILPVFTEVFKLLGGN